MTPHGCVALHTARLLLRPMSCDDEDLYCSLYRDARVMRQVGRVLSPARAARAFAMALAGASARPPRSHYWTIRTRASDEACGLLALVRDHADAGSAELGVLLSPGAQARGHASESIARVAGHAFSELGVQRLWTRHRDDHGAAHGLMCRLGFAPLATDGSAQPAMRRWVLCAAGFAGATSAA
jgi:[ribosomal protein S5]-alanine N-acetyltransferase